MRTKIRINAILEVDDPGEDVGALMGYLSRKGIKTESLDFVPVGPANTASGTPAKPRTTLYEEVTMKCSCYECYDGLARPDRIPWRYDKKKHQFVNSKHGAYIVPEDCQLRETSASTVGFIFIRPQYTLKEAKAGATIVKTKTTQAEVVVKQKEQELRERTANDKKFKMEEERQEKENMMQQVRDMEESIIDDEELIAKWDKRKSTAAAAASAHEPRIYYGYEDSDDRVTTESRKKIHTVNTQVVRKADGKLADAKARIAKNKRELSRIERFKTPKPSYKKKAGNRFQALEYEECGM